MHVTSAESTELFTGPEDAPLQLVRVAYRLCARPTPVTVEGPGLETVGTVTATPRGHTVEVPVRVTDGSVGERRAARVTAGRSSVGFEFTVAEPGWTMYMVSHFHYDPVWWNTQAAYTSVWTEDPPGRCRQTNGFELVSAHLETARREPEYKFVLAEVDYLKPYWDTHPEDRADLKRLIAEGRVEVMGGTYNEPNTNLTHPETAIRNFVHGIGFQRDVMGASPATAWQLDVFGHDPQFPGMAADAGLTSSSWARGPHHQWGPMADGGDPERMQFASEFEWMAPSGRGLLTHYMPAHYAAGWWMDSSASLEDAERQTYELFAGLKKVALTRNVLLPVGTDYTPPNKWVTDIHRDWAARYTWPKFVCALPSEFFAAVRAELDERGATPSPQTRDMNPIYTGCHVSYIDTKQANRAAEFAVLEAECFAVFAGLLAGATYPEAALAKAWVQLAYGAHHDAITGSESDQVYLDLLTSWRDAWQLGTTARDNALALLSTAVDASVVVWNPLAHSRTDIVTVHLDEPFAGVLLDADDREVPVFVEHDGHTVTWLAREVPSLGWRAYRFGKGSGVVVGWESLDGHEIDNEYYRLSVDAARGGGVDSLIRNGRELITAGRVGNELAVYKEYPAHPKAGEGPWHLLPKGPVTSSTSAAATSVAVQRSPLGDRIVVTGRMRGLLSYTQTITLWRGVDRVDCRTVVDEFTGEDRLLRLRWPCAIPGAMPVSEVGDAVIGRGFGLTHRHGVTDKAVDTAKHPYTLDNPAFGWFGLSSTVRVRLPDGGIRAISVAEVVSPGPDADPLAREVMVALARAGVTATCTTAETARYGDLAVDSNLPDVRISLGSSAENTFTAGVLAGAESDMRVWVPADAPLADVWVPGADLRGIRTLPVLVVGSADGLDAAVRALIDDLADAEIEVVRVVGTEDGRFDDRTVAMFNRGVPSFAVDSDGTLHTSLMRSCTGWPSGTWIDPPRRTAPDGSNFQLQHWSHTFDYAIAVGDGDWRTSEMPPRSAEFGQPLLGVVSHHDPGSGGLPPWGSLLEIEPAKAVALGALKALGNPTPHGSTAHVDPKDGIVLRLVESLGRSGVDVEIHSGLRSVDTERLDLLERPLAEPAGDLHLHGYEIATVRAHLNLPRVLDADHTELAPDAEPAQPLYARYWLHNRGPAPLGGLPAVAHLHPRQLGVDPGAPVELQLTAASDGDVPLHGKVRLVVPPEWTVAPDDLPFMLPPGEYLEANLHVTMPEGTAAGLYPIRAELALTGTALPGSWRQTVEDVCVVSVGATDDVVLRLVAEPQPVEVAAGGTATVGVTVGTDCHADLSVEAHLITPWGTWEWMGPNIIGADVPARGTVDLQFDVSPPPWVEPGVWWALIRVGCAGDLVYSPAVQVRVR
ncbi:glycoside hydrolase family 38 N-terminal domain-containing protein [Mycolicibacterium arenosum]|uniref:NEW3 domain-containing protein n=1 Tax=Mycolicibacterium arenosum TaxID=2952157 RepID=A0ABT1M821_9MYCO|nr:NEW3 domain-containing protein [Mycolicibacterium sp. CAU 1645]MCP9275329.1 NEW3 domain-containing protein [Mycolicibacterium sp. CAU 1645]